MQNVLIKSQNVYQDPYQISPRRRDSQLLSQPRDWLVTVPTTAFIWLEFTIFWSPLASFSHSFILWDILNFPRNNFSKSAFSFRNTTNMLLHNTDYLHYTQMSFDWFTLLSTPVEIYLLSEGTQQKHTHYTTNHYVQNILHAIVKTSR